MYMVEGEVLLSDGWCHWKHTIRRAQIRGENYNESGRYQILESRTQVKGLAEIGNKCPVNCSSKNTVVPACKESGDVLWVLVFSEWNNKQKYQQEERRERSEKRGTVVSQGQGLELINWGDRGIQWGVVCVQTRKPHYSTCPLQHKLKRAWESKAVQAELGPARQEASNWGKW